MLSRFTIFFTIFFICLISINAQNASSVVEKYYEYLTAQAQKATQAASVEQAYEKLSRAKTLNEYLQIKNINAPLQRIKKIRSGFQVDKHMAFFYPAKLYDNYSTLSIALDKKEMQNLQAHLLNMEWQLANIIRDEKKLLSQQQIIRKRLVKLKEEQENLARDIQNKNAELENLDIEDIEQEIVEQRSHYHEITSEILESLGIINRLSGLAASEKDKAKKIRLQRRLISLRRFKISREVKRTEIERRINSLELKLRRNRNKQDKLTNEIPLLQEKLPAIISELTSLASQDKDIIAQLNKHKLQLAPLKQLRAKQKEIASVTNMYQNWWRNGNFKPKYNFLLAVYILQNFSPNNYKIQVKEWQGLHGIVEVYYW